MAKISRLYMISKPNDNHCAQHDVVELWTVLFKSIKCGLGDVLKFKAVKANKKIHPSQKPVDLYEHLFTASYLCVMDVRKCRNWNGDNFVRERHLQNSLFFLQTLFWFLLFVCLKIINKSKFK